MTTKAIAPIAAIMGFVCLVIGIIISLITGSFDDIKNHLIANFIEGILSLIGVPITGIADVLIAAGNLSVALIPLIIWAGILVMVGGICTWFVNIFKIR